MNGRSVTVLSLPAAVNAAGTRSAWRHGDGIVIDDRRRGILGRCSCHWQQAPAPVDLPA
jgi:hypothetical protein